MFTLAVVVCIRMRQLTTINGILRAGDSDFALIKSASVLFSYSICNSILAIVIGGLPLISFSTQGDSSGFIYLAFLSLNAFTDFDVTSFFLLAWAYDLLA